MRAEYLCCCIVLLMCSSLVDFGETRRARTRSRTKSKFQIGLPITGKYRDPESDLYYNNKNGAKILMASHFDYEYVLGHKIAFICLASGNPRPHITWYKDGSEIFSHHYLNIHEWRIGTEKVKSKLEIDPATQMDAGLYECTADNMYSIDRRSFKTDFSIAFDWSRISERVFYELGRCSYFYFVVVVVNGIRVLYFLIYLLVFMQIVCHTYC